MRVNVSRVPTLLGHVDPPPDRRRDFNSLRVAVLGFRDHNLLNERHEFFAPFDGDRVRPRRNIDDERMCRQSHMLFETVRSRLPLELERRPLGRGRLGEVPLAVSPFHVEARSNRKLAVGIDHLAAQRDGRLLSRRSRSSHDNRSPTDQSQQKPTERSRHECPHDAMKGVL